MRPDSIRNFLIVLVQFSLIFLIITFPLIQKDIANGYFESQIKSVPGVLLTLLMSLGLALLLVSGFFMRKSLAVKVSPRENAQLITKGPFKYSRNPMYVGLIVMAFDWAMFWGSIQAAFLACMLYLALWIKAVFEEETLFKKFGNSYKDYCLKTPRFILNNF